MHDFCILPIVNTLIGRKPYFKIRPSSSQDEGGKPRVSGGNRRVAVKGGDCERNHFNKKTFIILKKREGEL